MKKEPRTLTEAYDLVKQKDDIIDALKTFLARGATYASFIYTKKENGETSQYVVNLNVDYQRVKQENIDAIKAYVPTSPIEEDAKRDLLVERPYTSKDTYTPLGKGIKIKNADGNIYIDGWVQSKKVITPGISATKKPVQSRELTIAKNEIKKKVGFKRPSTFIFSPDHIKKINIKGETLEFETDTDV